MFTVNKKVMHVNRGKFAGSYGIIPSHAGTIIKVTRDAISIFDDSENFCSEMVLVQWENGVTEEQSTSMLELVKE